MVGKVEGCASCRVAISGVCWDHRTNNCHYCGGQHTPKIPGVRVCWRCNKRIKRGQSPLSPEMIEHIEKLA
jgi:hypothetical protein